MGLEEEKFEVCVSTASILGVAKGAQWPQGSREIRFSFIGFPEQRADTYWLQHVKIAFREAFARWSAVLPTFFLQEASSDPVAEIEFHMKTALQAPSERKVFAQCILQKQGAHGELCKALVYLDEQVLWSVFEEQTGKFECDFLVMYLTGRLLGFSEGGDRRVSTDSLTIGDRCALHMCSSELCERLQSNSTVHLFGLHAEGTPGAAYWKDRTLYLACAGPRDRYHSGYPLMIERVSVGSYGDHPANITLIPGVRIRGNGGVSLCVFREHLYIAFVDCKGHVAILRSTDGFSWGECVTFDEYSEYRPCLTVYGPRLMLAFTSVSESPEVPLIAINTPNMHLLSSFDGVHWGGHWTIPREVAASGPSLVSFDNRLCVAWIGHDLEGHVNVAFLSENNNKKDGGGNHSEEEPEFAFFEEHLILYQCGSSEPSLCAMADKLILAFADLKEKRIQLASSDRNHFRQMQLLDRPCFTSASPMLLKVNDTGNNALLVWRSNRGPCHHLQSMEIHY